MLRDGDVLARWGGEEFLLVMPDTSVAAALSALERLRSHIAQEAAWVDCPLGRVTFSAGLTPQEEGQSLDVTAHRADDALYEAKCRGRDRVVTATGAVACPTGFVPFSSTSTGRVKSVVEADAR